MSFILDALKKSENERQRRSGPSLATVRTGSSRGTGFPWIGLVAVLLAVNLVVVLGFVFWPGGDPEPAVGERTVISKRPAPPAIPEPAAQADARLAEPTKVDNLPASATSPPPSARPARPPVRSLAEESARGQPSPTPPTTTPALRESTTVTRSPDAPGQPVLPEPPTPPTVPTMTELVLDGRLSLPKLHVDIHVYSLRPEGRFVFINNRKYKEGEQLSEGPYVEEISGEGVILTHRGQRFLLPRD